MLPVAWTSSLDDNIEGGSMTNVYVSTAIKRDGVLEEERPHAEPPSALTPSTSTQQQQSRPAAVGTSEKALMKRTLVAQSKKIQQLMTKVDSMEAEREAMRQQVRESTAFVVQRRSPYRAESPSFADLRNS